MTTAQTDRLNGLLVNSAIKNPCAVATTANISLTGEQTIDGVTTSASRVLVKNQTSSIDNGIYVSDTGAWSRADDFNGNRDVVEGTLIKVNGGTTTVGFWYVSTTGSPVPGTDAINFGQSSTVLAVVTAWAQNILASASAAAAWVFIKVGAIADANTWAGVQTFATTIFNSGATHNADITMVGASIIEAEGAAVTAAATTNIWATDGNTVHVTGSTGITSFGTAPQAGAWMKVIFDSTPTLTQSANLNLNAGGNNVTVAADDVAFIYADTTTQMDVFIVHKSGKSVVSGVEPYILVEEQQTSGTAGGTLTSGSWQKRLINTEVSDASGLVSIASGVMALAAGTYRFRAEGTAYLCDLHKIRLQDTTNAATLGIGTSAQSRTLDSTPTISSVSGRFTIAGVTNIELQHQCQTTRATDGLGLATSLATEVYSRVEFWRESYPQ